MFYTDISLSLVLSVPLFLCVRLLCGRWEWRWFRHGLFPALSDSLRLCVRLRRGITAVMTGRDPPRFIPQFARFLYPSLRGSYTPVQEALTPQCMRHVHSSLKCTYTPVKEARKPSLTTSPPNDFCLAGLSRKLGISCQNYFASYCLMPLAAAGSIASEGPPMRRRERIA